MTDVQEEFNEYAQKYDTDLIMYIGKIKGDADEYLIDICRKRKLRKNVLLFLMTNGGDPDVGYMISRCLQEAYRTRKDDKLSDDQKQSSQEHGKFSVFVDGRCKSAGTLICLGADEIIMSGNGQLGPIDIQLLKKDEVGESESGLTPIQALNYLNSQSVLLFQHHFVSLRFTNNIGFSTKMAAKIASELTIGLLAPIYSQIDPIRLAEVDRSMRIAKEYGQRLNNKNFDENGLSKLLLKYPSHGFVIDRTEAKKIFKNVIHPQPDLRKIANVIKSFANNHLKEKPSETLLDFLTVEKADIKGEPQNVN